jgi:cobalt-zinc-cadmium efflux system outer membrane protein
VAEAHARVELADREAWPAPVFGALVAREGSAGSPANYIVLGTLGLPLPFWQLNQGERARARVDEDVALAEESATARAVRARIARSHAELTSASERLSLFTSTVAPQLEDNLALLRRGFDAGEIPLLNVAVARDQFLAALRDALIAYADYYRALAELEFAVGAELPEASSAATTGGVP